MDKCLKNTSTQDDIEKVVFCYKILIFVKNTIIKTPSKFILVLLLSSSLFACSSKDDGNNETETVTSVIDQLSIKQYIVDTKTKEKTLFIYDTYSYSYNTRGLADMVQNVSRIHNLSTSKEELSELTIGVLYDNNDRVTQKNYLHKNQTQQDFSTKYTYDKEGLLLKTTNLHQTITYVYNGKKQAIAYTLQDAKGKEERYGEYQYNDAGVLTGITSDNFKVSLSYDNNATPQIPLAFNDMEILLSANMKDFSATYRIPHNITTVDVLRITNNQEYPQYKENVVYEYDAISKKPIKSISTTTDLNKPLINEVEYTYKDIRVRK